MIRTPKEWDETCRECGGSGHVHKRERLSLWTPDEYAAVMGPEYVAKYGHASIDPKHDAPANAVVCTVHGGASIFEACKEGVALAIAYDRPVAFEFNGAVAVCRADADPEAVAEEWWKRAYGKTYEQSMRDR